MAITRAQLTNLVVSAAQYPLYTPTSGPTFTDVPASNVFYVSIETAAHQGVNSRRVGLLDLAVRDQPGEDVVLASVGSVGVVEGIQVGRGLRQPGQQTGAPSIFRERPRRALIGRARHTLLGQPSGQDWKSWSRPASKTMPNGSSMRGLSSCRFDLTAAVGTPCKRFPPS